MPDNIRFTIDVDGIPRKLLSVSKQQTGLIFDHKPSSSQRPILGGSAIDGRIHYDRSTLHYSMRSSTGNLITRTSEAARGLRRHMQFTLALKTNNNFAPLIARRFPDLSKWEQVTDGHPVVSLGAFDPSKYNLITCVYVSKDCRSLQLFDPHLSQGIKIVEAVLDIFRITILYAFYPSPSINECTSRFYRTTHPKMLTDQDEIWSNRFIMSGFDDYYVLEDFLATERRFQIEFLQTTGRWLPSRYA